MLDEKQQATEVKGVVAGDVVVMLQIVQRLVGAGAIQDQELQAVGEVRNHLVAAMQDATGVNFDMARAAQVRAQQEAQARARQAQAQPAAPAPEAAPEAVNDAAPAAEEDAAAPAEA